MVACIDCSNLPGCRYLRGKKGSTLKEDLVLLTGERGSCEAFDALGESEHRVRQGFVGVIQMSEIETVRALYGRKSPSLEDLVIEEEIVEDVPDFASMIRPDMTVEEREAQITFQTNELGEILLDDDEKPIPRSSFPLRRYAIDPEGPIALDTREVQFWPTEQLITAILKVERDKGLIVRSNTKKKKDKEMPKTLKTARQKTATTTTQEASAPAEGSSGPATAKKRPMKKKAPGRKKAAPAAAPAEVQEAPAATVDLSEVLAKLDEVTKVVNKIGQGMSDLIKVQEANQRDLITGLTLVHDASMQKVNELAAALSQELESVAEVCPQGEDGQPDIEGENLYVGADPLTILHYTEQDPEG